MTRSEAYDRLRRVRDEFDAARFALAHTIRAVASSVASLQEASRGGTSPAALHRCEESLEINYIMRLFSEFESVLRDFWLRQVRRTRPRMQALMDRVADRLSMSPADRDDAHLIREYRNNILHQNPRALEFTYADCAKRLGTYLRWLPQAW